MFISFLDGNPPLRVVKQGRVREKKDEIYLDAPLQKSVYILYYTLVSEVYMKPFLFSPLSLSLSLSLTLSSETQLLSDASFGGAFMDGGGEKRFSL